MSSKQEQQIGLPDWNEDVAVATSAKPRKEPSSYIVHLTLNLDDHSSFCPAEVTLAEVQPHGAVTLCRFISDEKVQTFELSSAEVDALVATNKRRRSLAKRYQAARDALLDAFPF